MPNRIQEREQAVGALGLAQQAQRLHRPQHAVRVLAAIFADAWRVAADVAGVVGGVAEGWVEQHHQALLLAHERLLGATHRLARARRVATSEHGPRLSDGVDATIERLVRADRRAVVVEGAPVPGAVPGVLLDGRQRALDLGTAEVSALP